MLCNLCLLGRSCGAWNRAKFFSASIILAKQLGKHSEEFRKISSICSSLPLGIVGCTMLIAALTYTLQWKTGRRSGHGVIGRNVAWVFIHTAQLLLLNCRHSEMHLLACIRTLIGLICHIILQRRASGERCSSFIVSMSSMDAAYFSAEGTINPFYCVGHAQPRE